MNDDEQARVNFLISKRLLTEYKECLREDGRILTSDLNKHIRDYIREVKGRKDKDE